MSSPQLTKAAGLGFVLFITTLIAGWSGEARAQPPPVDIGTLGIDSAPVAINAQGQIAGENSPAPHLQRHAFSWTPAGGMIDLGTLEDFTSSYAVALNNPRLKARDSGSTKVD